MTAEGARVCPSCGTENPAEARFCFSCGASLEPAAAPTAESRKTVTVLFCDLVGSTAMGEQLDPETLRALLGRSFDRVQAIVDGHGGVVEKFIGDAVMAVFGIPRVHEDDALRAVRAAAEIREALATEGERASGPALAWRTGIATGEVVAGDASAGQRLVTGDAVNLAARLQQTAQPGEILITADTHRLVRDAVEVEPLGEVSVKGRQAPIEALRLREVDRSAAGHERRLDSPMVGRERPRRLLDDAFTEVRDQRVCHLFTILGAAGVGKSRLVNEFIGSLGDRARVLRGRCLSYGEGITYWPIGEIVRDAIGSDGLSVDLADERARVAAVLADRDDADRIAETISQAIGLTRGDASSDEIPRAVRSFLESLARERPLVVVLDDLQWAEPGLLDLVEHVADWSRDAPILLIVLARQDLLDRRPTWGGGKRSATSITLEPLDAGETARLVENLLGRAELPPTVFERIRAAAEGNPLFVEELVEMLIDEGALARADGTWTVQRDLAALSVPPTIQALLAARLDGLGGPERSVLERGSVEGTVFHRDAVAALTPDERREAVGQSLMNLTRREFVAPDRAELVGREAFRFRHQLIRDAAYHALAKQARAELHEGFADWLEGALGDRVDEYRAILGYHLEQSARYRRELDPADPSLPSLERRAVVQLGAASEEALDRGDTAAAGSLLRRILALLGDDHRAAMAWRLMAGEAFARSTDAEETNAFLLETRQIAEQLGDRPSAAHAEAIRLHIRASLAESLDVLVRDAEQLRGELLALGDKPAAARATMELAKAQFWTGNAGRAVELATEVTTSSDAPIRVRREAASWIVVFAYWGPTPAAEVLAAAEAFLADPATAPVVAVRASRSQGAVLAMLGRCEESRQAYAWTLDRHAELGDPILMASLKGHFMGPAALLCGDAEAAVDMGVESFEQLTALGHHGFANTTAAGVSRALLALGRDAEALEWVERALAYGGEVDPDSAGPALGVRARVLARRGELEAAIATCRRAVTLLDATDHLDNQGEAHADYAEVLRLAGQPDEALAELEVALTLFDRKGNLVYANHARERLAAWAREDKS
jgi:class 3 adenylate cyclase/tetratricopeptide (TPR) repeat protein